jgi:hypothetical protein
VNKSGKLRRCWRCDSARFWRSRNGTIRCAGCHPASAGWLIAERVDASPEPLSAIERARSFLESQFEGRDSASARLIIDEATRAGIAVPTLVRARWAMNIRSKKTRQGWLWIGPRSPELDALPTAHAHPRRPMH